MARKTLSQYLSEQIQAGAATADLKQLIEQVAGACVSISALVAKGAVADLCLFHPDRVWRIVEGELPGKAQNTPFDGRALEGTVLGTWKAGRRVFG